MKLLFFCFFSFVLLIGCSDENSQVPANDPMAHLSLIKADKAFSALCESHGMRNAFIEYLDSNGVLIRSNHLPMAGASAIDYLIQQDDSGFKLSWNPQHAEVSESGELGYTYGMYALRSTVDNGVLFGSYASVWKKQSDGNWKLLLESQNEGIEQ
jgi:hypothetical protein